MAHEWYVNGKRYLYRSEALLAAEGDVSKISFNLHGGYKFDWVDWSVEPELSWEEMLRIRAMQIRESYSFVRLWYSGGADSHTMLRAFIDNEIWPDEIAMFRYSLTNDMHGLNNREINNAAIPYLESIRSRLPGRVSIRIEDVTGAQHYNFWFKHFKCSNPRVGNNAYTLKLCTDKWADVRPQLFEGHGDHVAEVRGDGKAKPYVRDLDKHWVIYMHDSSLGVSDIDARNGIHQVPFYTTPDFPELHCKQAHMVKRYLKKHFGGTPSADAVRVYYDNIFKGNSETQLKFRTELFGASRNIDTQFASLGKHTDENGVKIWDNIIQAEAGPDNRVVKLYHEILREHGDNILQFNGLYGNGLGGMITYREYDLGE